MRVQGFTGHSMTRAGFLPHPKRSKIDIILLFANSSISSGTIVRRKLAGLRVVLSAAVISVALLSGGASFSAAQSEGPSAIRLESQEVVVPVFVVDKSNVRVGGVAGAYYLNAAEELDNEITGLTAKDFHVYEDGVTQRIQAVRIELPQVWAVGDNVSHHLSSSCTPKGIWSSPDLPANVNLRSKLWLLHVYLISYIPPPASAGHSCHQITVKVDAPHATAYARSEYCNTKGSIYDELDGTKLGARMLEYAESGKPGKFPVYAQASALFGDGGTGRADVAVEFPASSLDRRWNNVKLEATIGVLGLVYDKRGALVGRYSDIACHPSIIGDAYRGKIPIPRETQIVFEHQGIPGRLETQLDLPAGEYVLKLVVTDGEKFGRVEVPLRVEQPGGDKVEMSGILLCKRYHLAADGAGVAGRAPQYVPLASGGIQFTPTADTRFGRDERLISFFEIYEPLRGKTEGWKLRSQVRVIDAKTEEVKQDTGLRPVGSSVAGEDQIVPVAAEVVIDKLAAGSYRLEVQASDSAGNKTAWREASFTVN
jgi:hypothetical protein